MNKQKKQFVVVVILMAVCIIGYFGVGKFYKNQEEKEAGKLKDVIEELKVSAREKKGAAVQLVLSELI